MNKLTFFLLSSGLLFGRAPSVSSSLASLLNSNEPTHATHHVSNLIRHGHSGLSTVEKKQLQKVGLGLKNDSIIPIKPTDLDQTYDTDHFRFFYTLDQSDNDAVENIEYVSLMGTIFEEVWTFFSDSLGYEAPLQDPNASHELYEIYIENLPSYYFGVTYTSTAGVAAPSCASYIKMRNSYSGSQFSDHTEEENIKVTAVHEFFHSIQFSYNCYERFWMMEASAVWVEDELYDDINDLYRYMPSWFSNPDKPIDNETSHMYGSFIFFQYLDEHLGGPSTIRKCWEASRENYSPIHDISFNAIDEALEDKNSSFEDAYHRMRIANRILSSHENAHPFSYEEAEGYLTVVTTPGILDFITFELGDITTKSMSNLDRYEATYYNLYTETPVEISIAAIDGDFSVSTIVKYEDQNEWAVRTGTSLNIDPTIDIDYAAVVISSIGRGETNWSYELRFEDGYSEDFTLFNSYPNPSVGQTVFSDLQVIQEQSIHAKMVNILGQEIWSETIQFSEPGIMTLQWDGHNRRGQAVADGVYFLIIEGRKKSMVNKITFLKNSD